jgi:[ribosomal protein S18]-alanine N-acetyltransferase
VTVRAARPADIPALLAIERASFSTDRLTRRALHRLMTRGHCAVLVAVARRRVAGYAVLLFRRGSRRARLYSLAVDPRRRRSGLAKRLLAAVERRAAGRGMTAVTLEVGAANRAASTLYRAMGYRRIARLGPYYADGSPAERWRKDLVAPPR